MISASNGSGTLGQYSYDGDGKRVRKYVPSTGELTIFVYDASGKSIAEYSTIVASVNDAKVNYLTADHLGSPRINTDQNGNIIARHDYMPFGEEIDGTGGRTTGLNYGDDTVRKQFTGYERDGETDLDYAQARMYSDVLGRFTSTDPALNSGRPDMPSGWNRYAYSVNSPIKFKDKNGLWEWDASLQDDSSQSDKENKRRAKLRTKIIAAYDQATAELAKIGASGKLSKDKMAKLNNALNALGPKPGETGSKNGVTIGVGLLANPTAKGETTPSFTYEQDMSGQGGSTVSASISVMFTESFANSEGLFAGMIHEGSHVADMQAYAGHPGDFFSSNNPYNLTQYQTEYNAFEVNSYLFQGMGKNGSDFEIPVWNNAWAKVDKKLPPLEDSRKNVINGVISSSYVDQFKQPITPSNQGSDFSAFGWNRVDKK